MYTRLKKEQQVQKTYILSIERERIWYLLMVFHLAVDSFFPTIMLSAAIIHEQENYSWVALKLQLR